MRSVSPTRVGVAVQLPKYENVRRLGQGIADMRAHDCRAQSGCGPVDSSLGIAPQWIGGSSATAWGIVARDFGGRLI
jgi:hypothetical protein